MASDIYWIETGSPLRLAIMARPRAGDWLADEIDNWRRHGIGLVVSLLERDEVEELGLQDEASFCAHRSIEFISFPIPDRGVPTDAHAAVRLAKHIEASDKPTAIHCRAGIGRSSILAALVLRVSGTSAPAALEALGKARGLQVPDTDGQRDWLMSLDLGS